MFFLDLQIVALKGVDEMEFITYSIVSIVKLDICDISNIICLQSSPVKVSSCFLYLQTKIRCIFRRYLALAFE